MAIALEIGILDLISELLAHALVFGGLFSAAGAISTRALKSLLYKLYNFLIGILGYFHNLPPIYVRSLQKSVYDLFLCLLFVKSKRHELYKLLACYLADCRLVNK